MTDTHRNKTSGAPNGALNVAIIGAGIIGLSCAWRLARNAHSVCVYERDTTGNGASRVAAGILAPVSEVGFEDEDFLVLARESLARYPGFLDELAEDSGQRIALDTRGALIVALDRDDVEVIRREHDFRRSLGLSVHWLSGSEARDIEPLLSPRVVAAMSIPDDSQVDNRDVLDALALACRNLGVTIKEHCPVSAIEIEGGRCVGVVAGDAFERADVTIVAAGAWSAKIGGIPDNCSPPVRPVKGQIVELKMEPSNPLTRVVRAPDVYLIPKGDGRLLLGATQEEMGFDTSVTAGPVMRLIEHAWEAVPNVYELELVGVDVGLRPGSR
ncbi:MAG: glycine oxidase ThiO, partial [Candidatus Krumholzibacteriota bacterium]|nr:glycine oxidase ThiO [Candidatus Krumholzibacteriota bacterium]